MKALLPLAVAIAMTSPAAAEVPEPKLIVAISIDQFSADLFNEYRGQFTGGLKRLQQGAVFANGFQSHAATETCPGHSTILTGDRPARTGIIANNWVDYNAPRAEKEVYCVENEADPASSPDKPVASVGHLRVPTLGDRMKAANPASRAVAVSGKDRAAVMMGGKTADQIVWWSASKFATFAGRTLPASIQPISDALTAKLVSGLPAPAIPGVCQGRIDPVAVTATRSVGSVPSPLKSGDRSAMRTRPELDQATIDIATRLADDYGLGRGPAPDLLAVSLSVTDYVGHTFGTEGPEMCAQMMALDHTLDLFLKHLDGFGIPYVVVLTADHGGHDLAERNRARGIPDDLRVTADAGLKALNAAVGHAAKPVFRVEDSKADTIESNLYLDPSLKGKKRSAVIAKAKTWLAARPAVAAVFTRNELLATPPSTLPPDAWSLAQRAAASVDRERSGDLIVLLKPRMSPIRDPSTGSVATHGSPWDYDRRVPILFWSAGMTGFEQPNAIETVDIMPTLAALIRLPVPQAEIDGHCRDLDAGSGSTCPAN
jgi:predicted AlkP superfamily pyrophosphatase or phosphodiesterase